MLAAHTHRHFAQERTLALEKHFPTVDRHREVQVTVPFGLPPRQLYDHPHFVFVGRKHHVRPLALDPSHGVPEPGGLLPVFPALVGEPAISSQQRDERHPERGDQAGVGRPELPPARPAPLRTPLRDAWGSFARRPALQRPQVRVGAAWTVWRRPGHRFTRLCASRIGTPTGSLRPDRTVATIATGTGAREATVRASASRDGGTAT